MPGRIIGATILIPVSDLETSVTFYRDVLGFREVIRADPYSYVMMQREGMMVGLGGNTNEEALKATRENISAQIWVDDLDALWAEWAPALEKLPEGRVRAPFRQPYDVREFHLKDPDGFLMLFADAGDANVTD